MLAGEQPLPCQPLSFYAFDDSFPTLFKDYVSGRASTRSYFQSDFKNEDALLEAVQQASNRPIDRGVLVDVLLEQQAGWGLDDVTRANIQALRDPTAVAVVTGQQVGLFTGPLYTVYKTITAIQLAGALSEKSGRKVVPIFWLEGEDHDFQEISGIRVMPGQDQAVLTYAPDFGAQADNYGPVGTLPLSSQVARLIEQIESAMPPSDHKQELMQVLGESYREGATFLDAFARFLGRMFRDTGLILFNPADRRLKEQTAPLYVKCIEERERLYEQIRAVTEDLQGSYRAQVTIRSSNLFWIDGQKRLALDWEDGEYRVRGTAKIFTEDQLIQRVREEPWRLSPNVILRPVVQDTLLPTAVYIAGPGEISYFAQIKPAYEWAGVEMPVIYPRASVTLVESRMQSLMEKYHLSLTDLAESPERLFHRYVVEAMSADVEGDFDRATNELVQVVDRLKTTILTIDPTLVKTAESTRTIVEKELEKLKEKVVRAEKRKYDEIRSQIDRLAASLYPGGKLQERGLSPLLFIDKYGFDFIRLLIDTLSLDTTEHQVVSL